MAVVEVNQLLKEANFPSNSINMIRDPNISLKFIDLNPNSNKKKKQQNVIKVQRLMSFNHILKEIEDSQSFQKDFLPESVFFQGFKQIILLKEGANDFTKLAWAINPHKWADPIFDPTFSNFSEPKISLALKKTVIKPILIGALQALLHEEFHCMTRRSQVKLGQMLIVFCYFGGSQQLLKITSNLNFTQRISRFLGLSAESNKTVVSKNTHGQISLRSIQSSIVGHLQNAQTSLTLQNLFGPLLQLSKNVQNYATTNDVIQRMYCICIDELQCIVLCDTWAAASYCMLQLLHSTVKDRLNDANESTPSLMQVNY